MKSFWVRVALGFVVLTTLAAGLEWLTGTLGSDSAEQAQAAAITKPTVSPANPQRQSSCVKTLKDVDLKMGHPWKSYQRNGEYVTVEVRDAYYLADFDGKEAMDGYIRCAVSEGRVKDQGIDLVSYLDARTHKSVATWSRYTGFSVNE